MARKMKKARPFEKLMIVMLNGLPITKEEIEEQLQWSAPRGSEVKGPKIYNISSYIWDIKNIPQSSAGESMVIKSIRDGKKVTSYQLMNVEAARDYLLGRGLVDPPKVVQPQAETETA
jgi:hypothetical protein